MGFADKIVNSIEELPTLPTIYLKLLEAIKDPFSNTRAIADIIATDPSSAAKILKHVNTPFFGLKCNCDSLTQAISFLGYNEIKNLVLALSIIKMFDKIKPLDNFNIIDFWKHSIAVGVASRIIGNTCKISNLDNYLLSGLLHDIGKLVFLIHFYEEYSEIVQYAFNNKIGIDEAETIFFGTTHLVVGEILAERWMLPLSIRKAIRNHRTGNIKGEHRSLVAAVHVADIYSRAMLFGSSGDRIIPQPNHDALMAINLPYTFFTDSFEFFLNEYNNSINVILN